MQSKLFRLVSLLAAVLLAGRAAAAFRRGLGALDGQRDLAVRRNAHDFDLDRLSLGQDGGQILNELVRNLRDVDKAVLVVRQRNKGAKRFDAGDLSFDDVPYLKCQTAIPLFP